MQTGGAQLTQSDAHDMPHIVRHVVYICKTSHVYFVGAFPFGGWRSGAAATCSRTRSQGQALPHAHPDALPDALAVHHAAGVVEVRVHGVAVEVFTADLVVRAKDAALHAGEEALGPPSGRRSAARRTSPP